MRCVRFYTIIRHYSLTIAILGVIYGLAVNEQLGKLCAGVAILLFGMLFLSDGFKVFSGGILEKTLTNSTKTSLRSIIFGTIVTTLMQSSSLVSVLSISFVSAGLISLVQGIGVIFGANLGNTTGSWLIAGASSINISSLALPLIVGGLLFNFQKSSSYKGVGKILAGLGFFFLGVFYIKLGFEGFKDVMDFSQYKLEGYRAIVGFIFIGALITAVIQSSHATLAIIITAYTQSQIGYTDALAATLGTSVGGVVTALVASFSTNINGKRLAVANCIFNFVTVLIVAVFFSYFVQINNAISDIIGLGADSILRLAVWHTLFNFFGVVLFIMFIPRIAEFLTALIKGHGTQDTAPLFISDALLPYKDTAIHALENEVKHLYDNVFSVIAHSLGFSRSDICANLPKDTLLAKKWYSDQSNVNDLYHHRVKVLFDAIIDFSTKAQTHINQESFIKISNEANVSARNLAEATKNMILLEKNLKKNATSPNPHIAQEYNLIRIQIAQLLAKIESLKFLESVEYQKIVEILKQERKALKQFDKRALNRVEKIIIEDKVSANYATSLLNDIAFASNMGKEIIKAVSKIYKISWLMQNQQEAENAEHKEEILDDLEHE